MSSYKVYTTSDTFEPEDLVISKVHPKPAFGKLVPGSSQEKNTTDPEFQSIQQENFKESAPIKAYQEEKEKVHIPPPEKIKKQPEPEPKPEPEPEPAPAPPPRPAKPPERPQPPKQPPPPAAPPGIPPEEVQKLVTEAREKGIQEGLQQAEQDFGSASQAMVLICQQLDTIRETILQNSIGEIQELVLTIAEKIIRHSVNDQHETILNTVQEAIHRAVKSDEFFIYVNPDDYEIVSSKSAEMVAGLSGLNNLVIKQDITIDRGGCRIDSDNCTVDATILSQLEIISGQLKQQK
jgi:flagellar assembly protein FliH